MDIKKLKSAGICTIKGLQMLTKKRLCAIKGFSEAKVDKVKEACSRIVQHGFVTASDMFDFRKNVFFISTGSDELEYEILCYDHYCPLSILLSRISLEKKGKDRYWQLIILR